MATLTNASMGSAVFQIAQLQMLALTNASMVIAVSQIDELQMLALINESAYKCQYGKRRVKKLMSYKWQRSQRPQMPAR
jgi:hypothetical protein